MFGGKASGGMVDIGQLVPLVAKLGAYLRVGIDHYAALRAAGIPVTPDILATFVSEQMESWNPIVSGRQILDEPTKLAAARFLAGVVLNLSAPVVEKAQWTG